MKNPVVALLVVAALATAPFAARGEEWGSIKGRFVFGGDPPAPVDLKADKDMEVCGKHKLVSEEVVVGADKGVANVVVFVRDKDIAVNPDLKPSGPVVLDNKNCQFQPHVVVVQTGQELVIRNSDTVGHNSNVGTRHPSNPASNNMIAAGGETKLTFAEGEALPAQVTCNVHPWMKAWLVVRPNPYAAVSRPDGTFEIKGLPVGEVELVVYHEKAGYVADTTTTQGKTDKKGRIKVKVTAAGTDLGDIVIAPALMQK